MSPSPWWLSAGGGPLEELVWSLGENSHRCRGKTEPVMRTRNPGSPGAQVSEKGSDVPGAPTLPRDYRSPHHVKRPSSVQTAGEALLECVPSSRTKQVEEQGLVEHGF